MCVDLTAVSSDVAGPSRFYAGLVFLLFLSIVIGLFRVVRGPTRADRMLSAQLFGTTGVAILSILATASDEPALLDVALVFALLSTVAAAAFVRSRSGAAPEEGPD